MNTINVSHKVIYIFVLISIVMLSGVDAQQDPFSQSLSWGVARTELEKTAVRLAVDYSKNLGEMFKPGPGYFFAMTPELQILTGTDTTFNGFVTKLSGNFVFFREDTIPGGIFIPDLSRFKVLPVSIGLETDRSFEKINYIAELGFIPWYWNPTNTNVPEYIKKTKVGLFLQGGYKAASGDSVSTTDIPDESGEKIDSGLLRFKISGRANTIIPLTKSEDGLRISLIGSGDLWYDIINTEIYFRISAKCRLIITDDFGFDFTYEKGAGAPNFNQGDQFSANLAFAF